MTRLLTAENFSLSGFDLGPGLRRGERKEEGFRIGRHVAHGLVEAASLARNLGFRAHELNAILNLVREHETALSEAWHEYFGDRR